MRWLYPIGIATALIFWGCGGSSGGSSSSGAATYTGMFVDAPVDGLDYTGTMGSEGTTSGGGKFKFKDGEVVTFKLGNVVIGDANVSKNDPIVTPKKIVSFKDKKPVDNNDTRVVRIAQLLLSSDSDNNPNNGIYIDPNIKQKLKTKPPIRFDEEKHIDKATIANYLDKNESDIKNEQEVETHLSQEENKIKDYEKELNNQENSKNSGNNPSYNDQGSGNDSGFEGNNENNNDQGSGNDSSTGGNTNTGNNTAGTSAGYRLLAWNDLGMHCMDGKDFSVFSILPPYNNLVAQLIKMGNKPQHISSGVTITYEAEQSLHGKWNTTSKTKTNFWQYVKSLFGVSPAPDQGLKGNYVTSKTPHPLKYDSTHKWWIAEGIPQVPYNDDGSYDPYPLVKVVAKDSSGNVLATTTTVLPVSDEMDCKKCHSSTSGSTAAMPSSGWVNMSDPEKDFKYNILRLHDEKFPTAVSDHNASLSAKGWNYKSAGLEATANSGTPILCASCHKSNALPGTGVDNIKPLTEAIHGFHASVTDPTNGMSLNDSTNRNACYTCHPGATTQCLRGAMGSAKDSNGNNIIQCQSCHGSMSAVGSSNRTGWLDEPNCQSCHQGGKRYTKAVTDMMTGTLRAAVDNRFATNPNTPMTGISLYRYSTGHGKMQCEACHGATHAIYPSIKPGDNIQSIAVQGHAGTIGECTTCHSTVPFTSSGGPHGMHTIGQAWVNGHEHIAEGNTASCTACHGSNYRGSPLSATMSARTFNTEWGTKTFAAGHQVSCYDCHNGPGGDD